MENIRQLITIVSAIFGLLATALGFLIPLVKNVKAKNRLSALKKLTSVLQSLIMEAETFVNFTGAEKKEYVMTKANRYAIENQITYNEQDVSEAIEKLIVLSKEVNKRPKESTPITDNAISIII